MSTGERRVAGDGTSGGEKQEKEKVDEPARGSEGGWGEEGRKIYLWRTKGFQGELEIPQGEGWKRKKEDKPRSLRIYKEGGSCSARIGQEAI